MPGALMTLSFPLFSCSGTDSGSSGGGFTSRHLSRWRAQGRKWEKNILKEGRGKQGAFSIFRPKDHEERA